MRVFAVRGADEVDGEDKGRSEDDALWFVLRPGFVCAAPTMDEKGKGPGVFAGHDPARGSGHESFKNSRDESGRSKDNRFFMGRVGSGHEVINLSRVGTGHPVLIRPAQSDPTHENYT